MKKKNQSIKEKINTKNKKTNLKIQVSFFNVIIYKNKKEGLFMIRYVHGSEDSLDLDVIYVFPNIPSFSEAKIFCSDKIENRNIIVIEDGKVIWCFKGTNDEINNSLIQTYKLHNQEHPLLLNNYVTRDVLIKKVRVVRCLLSTLSRTQYRKEVKDALKSPSWHRKLEVLDSIDFKQLNDFGEKGKKEDILKTFAFQIGQLKGLLENEELYTKSSVAKKYPVLKDYLYRKENTDLSILEIEIKNLISILKNDTIFEKDNLVYFKSDNKWLDLKKEEYIKKQNISY